MLANTVNFITNPLPIIRNVENKEIRIVELFSPDLSPIEFVWAKVVVARSGLLLEASEILLGQLASKMVTHWYK
jgi:transposase